MYLYVFLGHSDIIQPNWGAHQPSSDVSDRPSDILLARQRRRLGCARLSAEGIHYRWVAAKTVKAYGLFVVLFLVSLLMFFIGAIMGSPAVALAGFLLTFALFLLRRVFMPKQ